MMMTLPFRVISVLITWPTTVGAFQVYSRQNARVLSIASGTSPELSAIARSTAGTFDPRRSFPSSRTAISSTTALLLSEGEQNDSEPVTASSAVPRRKRRVTRRKDATEEEESTDAMNFATNGSTSVPRSSVSERRPELRPRQDSAVAVKVTDIRELTGQKKPAAMSSPASSRSSSVSGTAPTAPFPSVANDNSRDDDRESNTMDSLERLLADAKQMEALEAKQAESAAEGGKGPTSNLVATVRSAISTIVTVDFFFVCFLLLWFLTGIFGSYILKNDTIQIAFNSNFQQIAQPALGILMIGSVAGAFFNEDEDT